MKTFAALSLWTLLAGPVLAQDPFAQTDPFLASAPAETTYGDCYARHKRDRVPLVVLFTTDHCKPCEEQKALWACADLHGLIFCKVHSSESVCARVKVDQFPTTILFLPDGSAYRFVGLTATEKILRSLPRKEEAKPARPFDGTRPTLVRRAAGSNTGFTASTRGARTHTAARRAEPCGITSG